MVRIQKISPRPPAFLHRRICLTPGLARLRTDNRMFSVRLIPYRRHFDPGLGSHHTSCKLRLGLMSKSIAHAHRKFWKFQFVTHYKPGHPSLTYWSNQFADILGYLLFALYGK